MLPIMRHRPQTSLHTCQTRCQTLSRYTAWPTNNMRSFMHMTHNIESDLLLTKCINSRPNLFTACMFIASSLLRVCIVKKFAEKTEACEPTMSSKFVVSYVQHTIVFSTQNQAYSWCLSIILGNNVLGKAVLGKAGCSWSNTEKRPCVLRL